MKTGVVKKWIHAKGFGFITVDGSSEDLFVHQSGLIDQVNEGDRVSFEIEQGKRGPNAAKVKKQE